MSSVASPPPSRPRFGIQLPEVERVVRWPEYGRMAQAAEQVGFDQIWVGDHLLYRGGRGGERGPWEAFTLLSATSYGGLFTFLAAGSFVFIGVLGLSKTGYGLLMLSMSLSYIVGTFICRRLLPRFGVRRTVAIAAAATLTAGTSMGVMALAGVQSVAAIMVPFYLFMLGHGVHQPCGQSGAVGPFPQAAGAASALSGFLMMVTAFFMGGWLGRSLADHPGSVTPLTHGVWFWSVAIALTAWTLVQRHGEPATPPVRVAAESTT